MPWDSREEKERRIKCIFWVQTEPLFRSDNDGYSSWGYSSS